ncbi:MAG TPA: M3 family metallopeptidase, partial [Candidatus Eisenbacteria bacterium]|nr:M3 family metallopeptidase [Candidatus Eisenbacteria bacterium]
AAATRPGDAPFWAARPNATQFAALQDQRLARAKKDVARMLAVKGPRTFENTLRPYDDCLIELDAVGNQTGLMTNVSPDPKLRAAAEKAEQKASAFGTELSLNRRVYDALAALELSHADAETRYYVTRTLRDFHLAGVDRDSTTRERIRALNDVLVLTGQAWDRNIREGSRSFQVDAAQLAGLPADFVAAHKPDAHGRVTLTIEYPDLFPVLTYASSESLRKKMYMESNLRGWPANVTVLDSLAVQRDRLAHLVGFPTFAQYFTADKMIGSADSAEAFIQKIVAVSTDRAQKDYAMVLARKRQDVPGADHVDWWDRFYWPERVRRASYDFDAQQMRPYLPYDRVKTGILGIASRMFGVTFKRVNVPVWEPSVEAYEVHENGRLVGRFYLDMHPRKNKYGHAAEFDIRTGVEGRQIPEECLVCNLPGGTKGDPGLCDFEDVNTFFHEFGHLLHAQFSGHHRWVGIGGIRTEQDFVEAPSQMLEEFMMEPQVLQTFARHYQTNQVIPAELVRKMKRAHEFGQGLDVRRQMVLADYSLEVFNLPPGSFDQDTLCKELNDRYTFYPFVPGTHFQCGFDHLNGYGAGYYTYMWSEVIAKDLFAQFDKNDLLDPKVATRYRDAVLAPGGSAPARQLVESFLGRPVSFEAYRRWLDNEGTPQP